MLPAVDTDAQWDDVVPVEEVMRPGVEDLCARLGLRGLPLRRFPVGSQPVYAVGTRQVLKLFPGVCAEDGVAEARVLSYLEGRLPVPTPCVYDAGTYENNWRYVLMSRLRGEDLALAWSRVPESERDRIATEAGETLAALHALDPEPLGDVLGPGDWGAFVAAQRSTAVERQRGHGLWDEWLDQIPGFLNSVPLPADPPRVLLHTEFMREHLLVTPHDDWRLTGLVDFEPAMTGHAAYDFVAVGLYVSRGDPRLFSRVAAAYGHTFGPRELLAYALLHVHGNFPRYLRELPAPPRPTLDSLAETWFGTG
ncbi:aminoglycoside phosphotransferase family protein [Streptomyces sp. MST-110588]|uniref:phosphotransferase family protein n=1 Tax=Streptomyces sp. MST-110588 TaxID=2833628 RepID=UPI001F5C2943|nr:aminoglycoside phosphotransferase family protein [Streptomyces sp. MST-110588]UNO40496.1 aminoglycoside phosphotransferase family protein [Streptomyces sp. MST-110588]